MIPAPLLQWQMTSFWSIPVGSSRRGFINVAWEKETIPLSSTGTKRARDVGLQRTKATLTTSYSQAKASVFDNFDKLWWQQPLPLQFCWKHNRCLLVLLETTGKFTLFIHNTINDKQIFIFWFIHWLPSGNLSCKVMLVRNENCRHFIPSYSSSRLLLKRPNILAGTLSQQMQGVS